MAVRPASVDRERKRGGKRGIDPRIAGLGARGANHLVGSGFGEKRGIAEV